MPTEVAKTIPLAPPTEPTIENQQVGLSVWIVVATQQATCTRCAVADPMWTIVQFL